MVRSFYFVAVDPAFLALLAVVVLELPDVDAAATGAFDFDASDFPAPASDLVSPFAWCLLPCLLSLERESVR
jgi:hypothetical protein